jgi:hypothetical protein
MNYVRERRIRRERERAASRAAWDEADRFDEQVRRIEERRKELTLAALVEIADQTKRIADVLEAISDPQTARLRIEGEPR